LELRHSDYHPLHIFALPEPLRRKLPGKYPGVAGNRPALRRWSVWIAFLFFFFIQICDSMAQQEVGRIRVETTLVNVPVMVSDQRGGSVLGLKAEDFQLYDDEVRQPLAFFAAAAEPIRVALLLDTSKSTITVLDRIRKAAAGFLDQLRPQDQAMLVSFDSDVHVLCRFGWDVEDLKRVIRGIEVGPYVNTRMYDAVVRVADGYLHSVQGRKAMILLTDGQDYGSHASPDDMIRAVLNSGVVVYPVFYAVDRRELVRKLTGVSLPANTAAAVAWAQDEREAAALLRRTAEDSAGAFFRSDVTDLKKTFTRVAEELRHQYLLAFYPDPSRIDDMQHTLRVDVSRPALIVRARRSYHATRGKLQ
jgi:Ca-activated chloride channel family protein